MTTFISSVAIFSGILVAWTGLLPLLYYWKGKSNGLKKPLSYYRKNLKAQRKRTKESIVNGVFSSIEGAETILFIPIFVPLSIFFVVATETSFLNALAVVSVPYLFYKTLRLMHESYPLRFKLYGYIPLDALEVVLDTRKKDIMDINKSVIRNGQWQEIVYFSDVATDILEMRETIADAKNQMSSPRLTLEQQERISENIVVVEKLLRERIANLLRAEDTILFAIGEKSTLGLAEYTEKKMAEEINKNDAIPVRKIFQKPEIEEMLLLANDETLDVSVRELAKQTAEEIRLKDWEENKSQTDESRMNSALASIKTARNMNQLDEHPLVNGHTSSLSE